MNNDSMFTALDSMYLPAVVCDCTGKIVFKNSFALKQLPSPRFSSNIENCIDKRDLNISLGENGVCLRSIVNRFSVFRRAVTFPFTGADDNAYTIWLFDVFFQCVTEDVAISVLERFEKITSEIDFSAVQVYDFNEISVMFRRFCEIMYRGLTQAIDYDHRMIRVRFAAKAVLESAGAALSRFGCATTLHAPQAVDPCLMVDYSVFSLNTLRVLLFALRHSDKKSAIIEIQCAGDTLETHIHLSLSDAAEPVCGGGFAELLTTFPTSTLTIALLRSTLEAQGVAMSFDIKPADVLNLHFTTYTPLTMQTSQRLHQDPDFAETETEALISSMFEIAIDTMMNDKEHI